LPISTTSHKRTKWFTGKREGVFGYAGHTGSEKREDTKNIKASQRIAMKPSKCEAAHSTRISKTIERLEYLEAYIRPKAQDP